MLEAELGSEKRREHEQYAEVAERAERLENRVRRLLTDDDILDQFDAIDREEV